MIRTVKLLSSQMQPNTAWLYAFLFLTGEGISQDLPKNVLSILTIISHIVNFKMTEYFKDFADDTRQGRIVDNASSLLPSGCRFKIVCERIL